MWVVGLLAYLVAVFHRSSLAVAGLDATERFDISASQLATFTMLQLLVYAGATRLGLVGYDVVAALATAALATLSWRLVERPVLRRVRRVRRHGPRSEASEEGPTEGSGPRDEVPAENPQGVPAPAPHDARDEGQRVRP